MGCSVSFSGKLEFLLFSTSIGIHYCFYSKLKIREWMRENFSYAFP